MGSIAMLTRKDYILLLAVILPIALVSLFISPLVLLKQASNDYPLLASFLKFAVLATLGEVIGQRIASGNYNLKQFGVLPKAIVWGVFGIFVKLSFTIFAVGVPAAMYLLGFPDASSVLGGPFSIEKLYVSFAISLSINLVFGTWLMTMHKVTDMHIQLYDGELRSLVRPIDIGYILTTMDWQKQWSFVLKKTIPLFWIPAHTVTFLLPGDYRVLFAALLGVVLGIILAFSNTSKQ